MRTINNIYNLLGKSILENAPEKWSEALLYIEVLHDFSSYKGHYVTDKGNQDMSVFDFPIETGDCLRELCELTSNSSEQKWNKAKFVVTPDNQFDMEFIWDQHFQDEVDRFNEK